MPATGAVCPRNNVAVASPSPRGFEVHPSLEDHCAWNIRLARQVANAIMLTLNAICSSLNFASCRGQHCTMVETHVIATASVALRFIIAVSRKGRFTDILPLIPGNLTFIRDVAAASARTASAKYRCRE